MIRIVLKSHYTRPAERGAGAGAVHLAGLRLRGRGPLLRLQGQLQPQPLIGQLVPAGNIPMLALKKRYSKIFQQFQPGR